MNILIKRFILLIIIVVLLLSFFGGLFYILNSPKSIGEWDDAYKGWLIFFALLSLVVGTVAACSIEEEYLN